MKTTVKDFISMMDDDTYVLIEWAIPPITWGTPKEIIQKGLSIQINVLDCIVEHFSIMNSDNLNLVNTSGKGITIYIELPSTWCTEEIETLSMLNEKYPDVGGRYMMISGWDNKSLICSVCGEKKSVKYEDINGKHFCNLCVLKQIGDNDTTLDDYHKECAESM